MSLADSINSIYQQVLDNYRSGRLQQAEKNKNVNRAQALTQIGADALTPAINSFGSAATLGSNLAPGATSTLSAGYTAPTYSLMPASEVAAVGTSSLGATSAAEAGTAATTAGEGASTAAGGAGASFGSVMPLVGLGLAVGSSQPGDLLFPVKKGMYNFGEDYGGHRQFRQASQGIQNYLFGKDSSNSIWANMASFNGPGFFNNIFGEPNQQESEFMKALRVGALKNAVRAIGPFNDQSEE